MYHSVILSLTIPVGEDLVAWLKKQWHRLLKAGGEFALGTVVTIVLLCAMVAICDSDAPMTEKVTFLFAAIGFVFSTTNFYVTIARPYFGKPNMKLSPDKRYSGHDQYVGLQVQNLGRNVARNCVVRLLDIRNSEKKAIWENEQFPQLNFYWERQNQLNQFYSVDIWGNQYSKFLDVAIHNTESQGFWLRLYTDNQALPEQVPIGGWEAVGRLNINKGTYYLQLALFADDNVFVIPTWYTLSCADTISFGETQKKDLKQLQGIQ